LVDPSDAGAVVRALARPPIELRAADLARCIQISRRRKLDMVSALVAATESPQLPPEARERVLGFLKLHRQAAVALDTTRADLFVHRLIERLGLRRQQLFAAQADVVERLVLAYSSVSERGAAQLPSPFAEEAREALDAQWTDHEEELFGPAEALHAAYRALRDELLADVPRVGASLGELRFDTDLDVAHAVVRYLELVKLGALLARPAGQSVADALPDINARLVQAVTPMQREILLTSSIDEALLDAEHTDSVRSAAQAARAEPSLEPFLPKRGEGLVLSASDIDTYRVCPLRYKFARVFRIPSEPTINQRFGILVHQVLERYHRGDEASAGS